MWNLSTYFLIPPTPNATKIVFMDNARAINPVTIDSTGENVAYLQPNSNYTMSGRRTRLFQTSREIAERREASHWNTTQLDRMKRIFRWHGIQLSLNVTHEN